MPKTQQHLDQAISNETLARSLCEGEGHYDWAVTVAFYAALHYFEAYLVKRGHNVMQEAGAIEQGAHNIRRKKAKQLLLPEQADRYIALQQHSERARYFTARDDVQLTDIPARYFSQGMARRWFGELEALRDYLM